VGKATFSSSVSLGTPRIFFVNHHHLAAVPPLVSLLHTVNDDEQNALPSTDTLAYYHPIARQRWALPTHARSEARWSQGLQKCSA
jgi:hypothetical protein